MNRSPLVSIIVITYNSSEFVLETLESAFAQTYQNIELIISDDCSTDDTVEVCKEWIEEHKDRFIRTEVVSVQRNTGIPANCNRGLYKSKGEWIKIIAGDDILLDNGLTELLDATNNFPSDRIFFTQGIRFGEVNIKKGVELIPENLPQGVVNNVLNAHEQYNLLLSSYYLFTPSVLFKKNIINEVGGFDEKYLLLEDYPFYLKCAKHNIRSVFLPLTTVKYRIHNDSVCNGNPSNNFINVKYKTHYDNFVKDKIYENVSDIQKSGIIWQNWLDNTIIYLGNKKDIPQRIIFRLGKELNPFFVYKKWTN